MENRDAFRAANEARPVTRLDLPVEADLRLLAERLDQRLPRETERAESAGGFVVHYRLVRGPIELAFVANHLRLRSLLRYQARAVAGVGPFKRTIAAMGFDGAEMPRIEVEVTSPVAIGAEWQLQTRLAARYRFLDRCEVGFVNLTGIVEKILTHKIETWLPRVEERLVELADLRGRAEHAWRLLHRPVQLRPGVWLLCTPESTRVGPVRGEGRTVRLDLGIRGTTRIVAAAEAPNVVVSPLPPVERRAEPQPGSAVHLQISVPWNEAERQLRELLVGRSVEAKGLHVALKDMELHVAPGERVELRLAIETDEGASGVVIASGRPIFDWQRLEVRLDELHYRIDSHTRLVQLAEGLIGPALLEMVRGDARLGLAHHLDQLRTRLQACLPRQVAPDVAVGGTIGPIEPLSLAVREEGLAAWLTAAGDAWLRIGSPPEATEPVSAPTTAARS